MNEQVLALFITLFLGVFIVIGAGVTFFMKKKDKFLDFALSFAFAVILMLIFTDLLPEVSEVFGVNNIFYFLIFVIVGILILRILDHFIPDHDDEHKMTKKMEKDNLSHIGTLASIALVIHNIIEGMAIYSTCVSSLKAGLMISLGVGCHNIPLGMVITSTLYQNNNSKKKTIFIIIGLMLSTFFGGFLMFLMNGKEIPDMVIGCLLSVTIGMLLYICSNELYPKIRKGQNKKVTVYGILAGIILILLTCLI